MVVHLVYRTEGISGYNIYIYIYIYMGVSYCYSIVCWSSVLIPFHSNPTFPEPDPWTFGGDYSGVQDLSFRTSARSPPPAGFAILSVFHAFHRTKPNVELKSTRYCTLLHADFLVSAFEL